MSPRTDDSYVGMTLKGHYRIEKELGRGGIGVVYLARDQALEWGQPVVIKVLTEESYQDDYCKKKFRQEIEALVRLKTPGHQGVVRVFGEGEMPDGKPYFVMQFVSGLNLRSVMKGEPKGMKFERVANIVRQIGQALSYVHARGIFHRDLKPTNIMLQTREDGEERVKLIDFGIAKVTDSQVGDVTLTSYPPGTRKYMAPEQLDGVTSSATDIYSLGLIAYEMVTGRVAFKETNSDTQRQRLQQAGVELKPRVFRPELPQAAEDAILKALSFHQKDRYAGARDFGEELARALLQTENAEEGKHPQKSPQRRQPTAVSPPQPTAPAVEIADSQKVKRPSNAWALTSLGGAVVASAASVLSFWKGIGPATLFAVIVGAVGVICGGFGFHVQQPSSNRSRQIAKYGMVLGLIAVASSLLVLYTSTPNYSVLAPVRVLTGHTGAVKSVAFSRDGKTIASGSADNLVMVWDVRTGELRWSLRRHTDAVETVAFSPDGKTLATGSADYNVVLWDLQTGEMKRSLKNRDQINSVAFSPDGKTLVCGSKDNVLRLWDTQTGALKRTLERHGGPVSSVAFSPDGATIASGSEDFTVILWNTQTGEVRRSLRHRDQVRSLAFSLDGRLLATGGGGDDKTVRLWNVQTGELKETWSGHSDAVCSVVFSPDGMIVVSGSRDKSVRFWSISTRSTRDDQSKETGRLRVAQGDIVNSVAFSSDGILATGSGDGTVTLWRAK